MAYILPESRTSINQVQLTKSDVKPFVMSQRTVSTVAETPLHNTASFEGCFSSDVSSDDDIYQDLRHSHDDFDNLKNIETQANVSSDEAEDDGPLRIDECPSESIENVVDQLDRPLFHIARHKQPISKSKKSTRLDDLASAQKDLRENYSRNAQRQLIRLGQEDVEFNIRMTYKCQETWRTRRRHSARDFKYSQSSLGNQFAVDIVPSSTKNNYNRFVNQ